MPWVKLVVRGDHARGSIIVGRIEWRVAVLVLGLGSVIDLVVLKIR